MKHITHNMILTYQLGYDISSITSGDIGASTIKNAMSQCL